MKKKGTSIDHLLSAAITDISNAIQPILKAIDICENDKGDERYDLLNGIKNKLITAKKRIKDIINNS